MLEMNRIFQTAVTPLGEIAVYREALPDIPLSCQTSLNCRIQVQRSHALSAASSRGRCSSAGSQSIHSPLMNPA